MAKQSESKPTVRSGVVSCSGASVFFCSRATRRISSMIVSRADMDLILKPLAILI
jgi:hypothetical protein